MSANGAMLASDPGMDLDIEASNQENASGLPEETPEEEQKRFEIELEFVQLLADPGYLNCM